MGARRLLVACALVAAFSGACGHSSAEVKRAGSSFYKTNFATVWNVVTAEVHREVRNMKLEDAVAGDIKTEWKLIERKSTDETSTTQISPIPAGIFVRYSVTVRGGGPWRVRVDAEAAEYNPGNALMNPLRRGGPEEPPWLQGRIDALTMAIHRRLAPYAIVEAEESVDTPRTLDTKPWADLPPAAAQIVARVHDAAKDADTAALRPLLAPSFTWSLAADPGMDQAVMVWKADPQKLRALAAMLAKGCAMNEANKVITCPGAASLDEGAGPRAGFQEIGGIWRFAWFISGP